jgi:mannose-1-phosphate guanylyltransferase/mannose-6-phosphate isomerase
MALAALHADRPDELLLFCPADHHIPDAAAFAQTVRRARRRRKAGAIVTFGVVPSFPSTAYGYIEQGRQPPDGSLQVARFIEKPDAARAQQLLLQGNVLWNAGIFLCRRRRAARRAGAARARHPGQLPPAMAAATEPDQARVRAAGPPRPSRPAAREHRLRRDGAHDDVAVFPSAASGATSAAGTRWPTCRRPTPTATACRARAGRTRRATPSSMRRTGRWWRWAPRTC